MDSTSEQKIIGMLDVLASGLVEFRSEFDGFRSEFNRFRTEMYEFRAETSANFNQFRAEMNDFRAETSQISIESNADWTTTKFASSN